MTRVLNVNDREIPRYLNEEMLKRDGYDVVSVATGRDALRTVHEVEFDVALLDVQLPDVDGFAICQALRADTRTKNLVVLMTSATFVTSKNKIAGLESGADAYLVQPFEQAELLATLRSLLRMKAAEREASALNDQLHTAMRARDEFLAMLGHELRNPIGAITTAMHLINEKADVSPRYLEIVSRQARNLTRIVDDLLDIARITQGKVTLEETRVDVRDVVRRTVDALADDIAMSKHEIEVDMPAKKVEVMGDSTRLEQVISNLVTNANKYTPAGGHITVKVSAKIGRAIIEVIDDGTGMTPDMQKRVFDLFVQGTQTIDRSRGGLGLGLTVVRQLVELHRGTVAAHSDGEGRGSSFVVELPLAHADEPHTEAPTAPVRLITPGNGLEIVVIEDNDDARVTLQEALTTFHHHVEAAPDGTKGLALVLETKPDVALVDIGLPGIDGYEIARQIRAKMDGTAPRLIAMTGYGQPEDKARALAAGFDEHIVKPVVLKRLQNVLAEIPRRHRS
ncbi:MAG: response regulator [Kofleriaceae bacterium]